ncbi:MAG: aminotransferase class III-fold pyridoxal phosphate-dependent enzyme, partial [Bacteroidia bacterium]|nr:aminotransferase class III-fold pyridoxal phosphate-dependent enzyme [Bacteroidia bacterium]
MSLVERDKAIIWHPYTDEKLYGTPIPIISAKGSYLFDENGMKYIDAISSWWTNIHGHSHPDIVQKVADQIKKLDHVIFSGFTHEPAVLLAEKLLARLPFNQKKIFYSDNGSTAVEVALKMAFQYWHNKGEKRTKVLAFKNGYHGDTFGAMAVSGRSAFTKPFEDMLFEVIYIDVPTPGNELKAISNLKSQISSLKSQVSTFIFEPLVQGTAGMVMFEPEVLNEMLAVCQQNNIITIADEVMTGFGRTGKFFATDHLSNKPDI